MTLPLYKDAQGYKRNANGHRGLWWSRFFDKYPADFSKPDNENGKAAFVAEICSGRCGDERQLDLQSRRVDALVCALGGKTRYFKTQGRFVTGMGNDHPTENGFTWHPTLGVPYLPASTVKGLVRGWLEWQWGAGAVKKAEGDAAKRQQLLNWFGSEHKSPRECTAENAGGWFVFFDALPVAPVQLAADVMTPHYGEWYAKGGGNNPDAPATVPADWHSPVPITFLTAKNMSMQFSVAVRNGLQPSAQESAREQLNDVLDVLKDALEWAGAGAKTATGYGRLYVDQASNAREEQLEKDEAEKRAELQREALEKLSPNLAAVETLRLEIEKRLPKGKITVSDAFWGGQIKKLALQALESGTWNTDEKKVLAGMLGEWAGKLMHLDTKDLRKQLKLAALHE